MGEITQKWVKMLIPYTSGYKQRFTESELSRHSAIPQQTASRYLKNLLNENIINYEIQGRNKLFFIDFSSPKAHTVLQLLENMKTLDFQNREKKATVIIEETLKHCDSVVLFGSYASVKYDEKSDMDIVCLDGNRNKIKLLKKNFNLQINEHYATYNQLSKALKEKNRLMTEIRKNHILFGNVSRIIKVFLEGEL